MNSEHFQIKMLKSYPVFMTLRSPSILLFQMKECTGQPHELHLALPVATVISVLIVLKSTNIGRNPREPTCRMYSEKDQRLQELLSILEDAVLKFEDDHITQSEALVQEVRSQVPSLPVELQRIVLEALQSPLICHLETLGICVTDFLNFLNDTDQWKQKVEVGGLTNSTSTDAAGVHYFKTAGQLVNVQMTSVFGALMENDLFHTWMPCCGSSSVVPTDTLTADAGDVLTAVEEQNVLNSTRRVVRSVFEMLMFKREALFFGVGDVLPSGDVFVFIKSMPADALSPDPNIPRVKLEGGFLFKQQAPQGTADAPIQVEIAFSFDPLLNFLPKWILNYCVEQVTYGLIPRLQEQARLFECDQIHHNRIVYGQGAFSPALPSQSAGATAVAAAVRRARAGHPDCIYSRIEERIWRARHSAPRHHYHQRQRQQDSECSTGSDADDDGSFHSLQRTDTPLFDPIKGASSCEPPSPGSVATQL